MVAQKIKLNVFWTSMWVVLHEPYAFKETCTVPKKESQSLKSNQKVWVDGKQLTPCSLLPELMHSANQKAVALYLVSSSGLLILRSAQLLLPDCSFFDQLSSFFRIALSSISSAPSSGLLVLRSAQLLLRAAQLLLPDCSFFEPLSSFFRIAPSSSRSAPSSGLLLLRAAQLLLPDCSFFDQLSSFFRIAPSSSRG